MGRQSADLLQTAIQNAATKTTGFLATAVGLIALVITASGVFTEMQSTQHYLEGRTTRHHSDTAPASPRSEPGAGCHLLVSLVISTFLSALSDSFLRVMEHGWPRA